MTKAYSAGIAIRHVEKYLGVISRKIAVPFSISFISHFAKGLSRLPVSFVRYFVASGIFS